LNESLLKRIDPYAWLPAVAAASGLRRFSGSPAADDSTVILRPGGMGDLIILCAAAEDLGLNLKQFFWVIERRSQLWAEYLKLSYVCYDPLLPMLDLAGGFSTVINTEQRFGLSQALANLLKAPGGKSFAFETNRAARAADELVAYDPLDAPEHTEFTRLLTKALNLKAEASKEPPVRLRMHRAETHRVVGIGGMQSPSRALTPQDWVALIRPWSRGRSFWICAAPADRWLADTLCLEFAGNAQRFDGSFYQMCDLVSRSEEVLTVDSGFLHIASYFGVPVTAHFTSGRARKWAALSPNSTIIRRSDLACQPCTVFGQVSPCQNQFACKDLTHAQDFKAV